MFLSFSSSFRGSNSAARIDASRRRAEGGGVSQFVGEGGEAVERAGQEKIEAVLEGANVMTIATVRPDGYPQATTSTTA